MITAPLTRGIQDLELGGRLATALDFLGSADLASMADGTYPIDGEDVYAMVQSFHVSSPIDVEFETHRKYADIQYVISGRLDIMIAPREELSACTQYDESNDVVFYCRTDRHTALHLQPGELAILYPDDAHRMVCFPGEGRSADIRKCVIKVRV